MATCADVFLMATQQYAAGNYPVAEQYCRSILGADPNHSEALHLLGVIAWHGGDLSAAADNLSRALAASGANPFTWQHLGDVHLAAGNFGAAAGNFEQALRLRPDLAQAHNSLGIARHHLGDCARACGSFREAIRLEPASAQFHNNLAAALKDQGLFDDAILQFQETLQLQPGHAMAIFSLSELAAAGRYRFAPDELDHLKVYIASGRGTAGERSVCCFALANVLDKQGAYDEAFAYYKQGNDLRKPLLPERNLVFDARNHEVLIDLIMAAYDGPYFERVKNWGTDSELPVFIIGMPRSGSTLVEQILASHPRVFGAGEIENVYRFITRITGQQNSGVYNPRLVPSMDAAHRLAAGYLQHLAELGPGAARVTNKHLDNFLHLGIIATLFPRGRIIHCRRDPLDLCLSCYFQNFLDVGFACSLEDIGAYYRAYEKLMAHWSRVLPVPIHEVSYEELVNDQETVSRKLLSFCGLDWDERCLTFWNTRRVVQTASAVQVRKPISRQAIGRWRHYRSELGPLLKALGMEETK